MIESEEKSSSVEIQKAKIRERYKGIDPSELDVIPAIQQASFYEDTRSKRVAVYARVSTDDPHQTSSYELQKNHYMDVVSHHEGWELQEIYADEGISGTSLKHRDSFIRMIEDCQAGKIDLIITKSVSRFARNILDCIGHVRELAKLKPPIGVFFETENLYTLDPNSEMALSFMSTLAQEESHNKSDIMNSSIEMRFRRGIFLTPALLGYDVDEDGNLVINPEEAKTVTLIFFMYLYGYTCTQIAETLTKLGRRTKKGNIKWSAGTVLAQLQNERHCGDVLARKTWTPSYLDHKSKKNRQDRNQYRQRDHHEPIISRGDFLAVQRLICNAKYGGKEIMPQLNVIEEGALQGFVIVNPRWSGFSVDDYRKASSSVYNENHKFWKDFKVEANEGDFDLSGFEIARSQFFDVQSKMGISFSANDMKFSTECIKKLSGVIYIELLVHPELNLLAVRPSNKKNRCAIKWNVLKDVNHQPRAISGKAFLPTIYDLFNWDKRCKYNVRGVRKTNGAESFLIFRMDETEMFFSQKAEKEDQGSKRHTIHASPIEWEDTFGDEYYRHAQIVEILALERRKNWKTQSLGKPFLTEEVEVSPVSTIKDTIDNLVTDIKMEEEVNDGTEQ